MTAGHITVEERTAWRAYRDYCIGKHDRQASTYFFRGDDVSRELGRKWRALYDQRDWSNWRRGRRGRRR